MAVIKNNRIFKCLLMMVISLLINNILQSGELDETSVGFSDKSSGGRKPKIYNLDMILSVGYRVNSKRGIAFRRWANSVLKQYIIDGYAVNDKRLQALQKTVDIQTRMLACALDVEESDVLKAVNQYTEALILSFDGKSGRSMLLSIIVTKVLRLRRVRGYNYFGWRLLKF